MKILSLSLAGCGLAMIFFGMKEMIVLIGISGFAFFFMLPFANTSLDYLVRTNIPDELQGRAWGVIGFISQSGYVVAYALFGLAADTVAKVSGIRVGRGAGLTIIVSGVILVIVSAALYRNKEVRKLEAAGQ